MVQVAAELGYPGAAVAPVVARAGVSRRTFYELFDGREDCFLAAFEWTVDQLRGEIAQAYSSQGSWREGARQALAALLALLDSEPELARVGVVEALGAGQVVLQRRAEVLDELIALLAVEAPKPRGVVELPLLTAEGVVGAVLSIVHTRLVYPEHNTAGRRPPSRTSARDAGSLSGLHGHLMALIVLPYLGRRAAREESNRPAPDVSARQTARRGGDGRRLLERLDMRLTYRTMRCLTFIRENPGASNREIASGAEIPDEGQTSKLLGRLEKLDLIANSRPHGPGFPNRWTVTPHGEQVLSAVQR